MKIDRQIIRDKPLEVHAILTDVPLLDVWQIELDDTETPKKLEDLLALTDGASFTDLNIFVRALFAIREGLGKIFKWEGSSSPKAAPNNSFAHQIPDALAQQSKMPVGDIAGPIRVMYELENEFLGEVMNATTHAFIHLYMEKTVQRGYVAYLSVYAINTKWWSKYYMALIEPFRNWLVYPNLIRTTQQLWRKRYTK